MGVSTRRSMRLAEKGESPSTPGASGGVRKKATSKVKKVAKRIAKAATGSSTKSAVKKFPDVQLKDHTGADVRTSDVYAESAFVVFLYPKANTPGCTNQACGFRDGIDEITKAGYKVFGLSYDSPKSQNNWKVKHNLPYPLWCDTVGQSSLIQQLGAHKAPKSVKRSHFVVAKGGEVLDAHVQISPKVSVSAALQFIKENAATGKSDEKPANGDAMEVEKEGDAKEVAKETKKKATGEVKGDQKIEAAATADDTETKGEDAAPEKGGKEQAEKNKDVEMTEAADGGAKPSAGVAKKNTKVKKSDEAKPADRETAEAEKPAEMEVAEPGKAMKDKPMGTEKATENKGEAEKAATAEKVEGEAAKTKDGSDTVVAPVAAS